jgi:hypothetical protein
MLTHLACTGSRQPAALLALHIVRKLLRHLGGLLFWLSWCAPADDAVDHPDGPLQGLHGDALRHTYERGMQSA